jgi:NAD(P)-dependent dehydrogenase (short-subunit alcohol dehydrogenase family)
VKLNGKKAIVTGGAVRLGRAIVLALADAGVDVAIHYGSSAAAAAETCTAAKAAGVNAITIQADLTDPTASAEQIVSQAADELGSIDILINSAAIFEPGGLQEVTPDQWQRTLAINLQSPTFLSKAFAAQLSADRRGHILNIVDWRATRTDPEHLVYTLSKSGLVSLTRNLAVELAPAIQVNAIAPGAVLPPPGEDESYLQQVASQIPLDRSGSPVDITDALLYLLRSDFITGEVLHVAGGQQI